LVNDEAHIYTYVHTQTHNICTQYVNAISLHTTRGRYLPATQAEIP